MGNKTGSTQGKLIEAIKYTINNAKDAESYLFLGKAYDAVLDKALAKIPAPKSYFIETYSVGEDFNFTDFIDVCTGYDVSEGRRLVILRLKNRGTVYQRRLLVPLDKLILPLLVFVDYDIFIEPFMSRFGHIKKQPNEDLRVKAFIPPNKVLTLDYISSPYICPSLIKLGNYNKLSLSNKIMDILISSLSDGKVYPEVLSELQPPIKGFDDDIKLETLSLLKQRFSS